MPGPHERMRALSDFKGVCSQRSLEHRAKQLELPVHVLRGGQGPVLLLVPSQGEAWLVGQRIARVARSTHMMHLFETLIAAGASLTREQLYERVWGLPWHPPYSSRALSSAIHRLRAALRGDALRIDTTADGRHRVSPARAAVRWQSDTIVRHRTPQMPPPMPWHNLQRKTQIIGRDRLIATASEHLQQDRWIELWGPGGIGKSTVGLAVAHRAVESSQLNMALWVDLENLVDTEAQLRRTTLEAAGRVPSIDAALGVGEVLLVLDGAQAAPNCVSQARRWMQCFDGLSVLITTRRVFNLGPVLQITGLNEDHGALLAREVLSARGRDAKDADLRELVRAVWGSPLHVMRAAAHAARHGVRPTLGVYAHASSSRLLLDVHLSSNLELVCAEAQGLLASMSIASTAIPTDLAASLGGLATHDALQHLDELADASLVQGTAEGWRLHPTVRSHGLTQLGEAGRDTAWAGWNDWVERLTGTLDWPRNLSYRWSSWPLIRPLLEQSLQRESWRLIASAIAWFGLALSDNLNGHAVLHWTEIALLGVQGRRAVEFRLRWMASLSRQQNGDTERATRELGELSKCLPATDAERVEIGTATRLYGLRMMLEQDGMGRAQDALLRAAAMFEKVCPDQRGMALVDLGRVLSVAGKKAEAIVHVRAGVQHQRSMPGAWLTPHVNAVAARVLAAAGDVSLAVEVARSTAGPTDYGPRRLGNLHTARAVAFLVADRPIEAERAVLEGLAAYGTVAPPHVYLVNMGHVVWCRLAIGDPDGAEKLWSRARADYGEYPVESIEVALRNLPGRILVERMTCHEETPAAVLKMYQDAVRTCLPTDRVDVGITLAQVQLKTGDSLGAAETLRRALQNAKAAGNGLMAWRVGLYIAGLVQGEERHIRELKALGLLRRYPDVPARVALATAWSEPERYAEHLHVVDAGHDALSTRSTMARTLLQILRHHHDRQSDPRVALVT